MHSIVTDGGGHIEVQSRLGVGTFFRIYLPIADVPFVEECAVEAAPGLTGEQVIAKLRDIDPSVSTIITSGHFLRLEPGNGREGRATLLPKPGTRPSVAEALEMATQHTSDPSV